MRKALLIAAAVVVTAALAGCGVMPERPKTVFEQIEAAEITAQQLGASIVSLTCGRFEGKRCVEPGKAFTPDEAIRHHQRVQDARKALRTAAAIGAGGVGECLGEPRNQVACLAAARSLLTELERKVIEAQGEKR